MGSIPITRSSSQRAIGGALRGRDIEVLAHVAQSVEHVLGKDEVTGSIPVVGSSRLEAVIEGFGFLVFSLNLMDALRRRRCALELAQP